MSYLKRHELILVLSTLIVTGCTTGLDAGSIEKTFTGIKSTKVTGPETVQISWNANSGCEDYGIYRLGTESDNNKIADATLPPYTVKSPYVESERSYTFAVGCNKGGKVQGLSVMLNAMTWPKFNGTLISSIDASGQKPIVVLKWNYAPSPEVVFDLYVKPSPLPTSISTWTLNRIGGVGSAYGDAKLCSVMGNQVRLGEGSCPALEGGQGYMFKVVARYPDGSYSTDLTGVGSYIDVPPPFAAPDCILTSAGIGADASTSSLFLRCSSQALAVSCPAGTLSTRVYQGVSGTRISVSDTLTGPGTLRIQPQISANQLNDRSIENLEIEYTCATAGLTQKSSVRYDGNPVTRPDGTSYTPSKPVLKFNSSDFVRAPNESKSEIPSYYGKAIAVGDFNCDGKPDLAVGLPDVTFNQAPYYSKNPASGAVVVYYGYVQHANGSISSADTQYLSFSDLPPYAHMGASLSAGNINRDYVLRPDGNTYACDDLIIGAPGDLKELRYLGEAYIFYGHQQKFSQPLNRATLTVNDSSCHGSIDASVCDPVRLRQDMQAHYKIAPSANRVGSIQGSPKNAFGFSVAYIRDFNADGYGDVAIGDPYCHWDGEVRNGMSGDNNIMMNVGCAYVYWGGPYGLQKIDVGPEPGTANRIFAPFVKIFPPIPQEGMLFGWSIGGGGDVDGRLPVPILNNAGNVILAEGNDFVIGAPGFRYNERSTDAGSIDNSLNWTVIDGGGNEWRDPIVTLNEAQAFEFSSDPNPSTKITPPTNGAWTTPSAWSGSPMPLPTNPKLQSSTGIAFLYLGRSSMAEYTLSPKSGSYYRVPKAVTDPEDPLTLTPGAPTILNLISANTQSRQNGSKGFTLGAILTGLQPNDSFYNCGTRGASGAPRISGPEAGQHKHISCLAGRNNTSWIFPQLTASDDPVSKFGSNVAIAGTKEQNSIALQEIGNARIQNTAANTYQRQLADGSKFVGYAQGNIHERIIGDSLWEMGYRKGTFNDNQNPLPCEDVSGAVGDMTTAAYDSSSHTCQNVRPARSAIRESYANLRGLSSVSDGNIQSDINRDGYADVLITADSGELYTFFGNYAADFAYAYNLANTGGSGVTVPYSTTSNCSINNYANVSAITSDLIPYSTFTWAHALSTGSVNYTFTSTHPVHPSLTAGGYSYRLGYIGDTGTSQTWSYAGFPGYTSNANILSALKNCLPQRKKYLTAPTSIVTADLNDDHIVDGILGYPDETSQTGMVRAFIANSGIGGGLASEFVYNSGVSNWAKAGSALGAVNWRFIKDAPDSSEVTRRDLFVGAPYSSRGNGSILAYSGYNGGQLAAGSPATLTFTVPIPSSLGGEASKIIGDINGDGYDDIFVPVKRLDARGNIYYDAILYFGSSFGPITTPMCLSKQASITKVNGSGIASSDCNPSTSGQTALLGGSPIRMPQYYSRPSGMSANWALSIQPAGDINGDGRSDLYVIDGEAKKPIGSGGGVIFAVFGSDLGLSGGSPAMGPSTNKAPQIVTYNSLIIRNMSEAPGRPSTSMIPNTSGMGDIPIGTGFGYAHGDFNGDGYEDVAWGLKANQSFQVSNHWTCNPVTGSLATMSYCGFKDTFGGITYDVDPPTPGQTLAFTGAVLVMYGGPQGVQTPMDGMGTAVDFDYGLFTTCDDFYHGCKKANPNSGVPYTDNRGMSYSYNNYSPANPNLYQYVRLVYGSISRSGNGYAINTTASDSDPDHRKPACVPGTGFRAADICLATMIPTPAFYNVENSWSALMYQYFGAMLQVADVNGDGIDDLLIGHPRFYHSDGLSVLNTTPASPAEGKIINAPLSADPTIHGAVFIYYGARGYGLVAPGAERYLGPHARGVDGTNAAQSNALVFQIYPYFDPAHKPALDQYESDRSFGTNITAGDFNGDGNDDIAIASGRGHVYVYYGPICQWDNSSSALGDPNYSMYYKPNVTIDTTSAVPTSICQTVSFANASDLNPLFTPVASKRLAPQLISIAGLNGSEWMGTTLLSMRKGKGNLKNANIASENQKASDLIIAGSNANDPNASSVSYKTTGLGYTFFGHTTGDPLFKTKGGLYIGNSSYNSSITKVDVVEGSDTVSYFYYSPILLRPHTTNSSVARFFFYTTTVGDVNGDGRMDLLMPTVDLDTTQDGTNASYGGGFRLFY